VIVTFELSSRRGFADDYVKGRNFIENFQDKEHKAEWEYLYALAHDPGFQDRINKSSELGMELEVNRQLDASRNIKQNLRFELLNLGNR